MYVMYLEKINETIRHLEQTRDLSKTPKPLRKGWLALISGKRTKLRDRRTKQ